MALRLSTRANSHPRPGGCGHRIVRRFVVCRLRKCRDRFSDAALPPALGESQLPTRRNVGTAWRFVHEKCRHWDRNVHLHSRE